MKFSRKQLIILVVIALVGIPILGLFQTRTSQDVSSPKMAMMPARTAGSAGMGAPDMMVANVAQSESYAPEAGMAKTSMPMPPMDDGGFTAGVDRVIVKNADMSLLVDDTRDAVSKINTIASQANGTVTHSAIYQNDVKSSQVMANITLRVPVEQVETVMNSIRQVASKVVSENLSAQDRTEQKVDLDAQLNNLRATEAQLQNIMTQAKTVEETLKVQSELSNVRGQIERLEAQLENLLGDAAMSTISITLSTEEAELPIVNENDRSIWQEIKLAVRDAITLYRDLFVAGLRLLILALPIIIIGSIGYGIWRKKKS